MRPLLRRRVETLETGFAEDHKILVQHVERCEARMKHAIRVLYGILTGLIIEMLIRWITASVHVSFG